LIPGAAENDYSSYIKDSIIRAASYNENCYGRSSETGCPPLGRGWVTYNMTEIECPFHHDICTNNTAIRLDTGMIDSTYTLELTAKGRIA
jgi:hypothetical protein